MSMGCFIRKAVFSLLGLFVLVSGASAQTPVPEPRPSPFPGGWEGRDFGVSHRMEKRQDYRRGRRDVRRNDRYDRRQHRSWRVQ